MKLSLLRRISQGATFTLFIGLFVFTMYPFATHVPLDVFLRLDPLVALIATVASRAFLSMSIWALALLVFTAFFGRFFCGYICPLGTLIDISDFLVIGKKHKKENGEPKPQRRVKYFILIGVIFASLLGANFLSFFSPMAIAPRSFTLVVFPPVLWLLNAIVDVFRPLLVSMGFDSFTQLDFGMLYFATSTASLVLLVGILVANYWRKRFWCRYVCPTGALLSIFSRFGIIKRRVDETICNDCKLCSYKCDMRAIDTDPKQTVLSECTLCGDCIDSCKKNAVSIGIFGKNTIKSNMSLDVGRRQFMQSAGAGLILASTVKSGVNNLKNINGRFIRPPGSLPENEFLARCIRCGECMKVCKTNTLQPTVLESGLDALWTPHLEMRRAPCEKECNMCGYVCPTQAIRPLPLEEKQFVRIGIAVIDRSRCIAWEQNKLCLICDEICPYNAIETKVIDDNVTGSFKRPVVLEDKCTGCGYCEKACPVYGRGAIEVYSIGEERKNKGSYITENKKKLRFEKEGVENSYSAEQLGSGGESSSYSKIQKQNGQPGQPIQKQVPQKEEELPKGFSD